MKQNSVTTYQKEDAHRSRKSGHGSASRSGGFVCALCDKPGRPEATIGDKPACVGCVDIYYDSVYDH